MSLRPCARAASIDPVAQGRGALLIGLDRDPEAAPAIGEQLVVGEQRLEHVELQLEPVGFLGVDGEMNVGRARLERQLAHDRQDRRPRASSRMAEFEARVKRGQLDRNARRPAKPVLRFAARCGRARRDRSRRSARRPRRSCAASPSMSKLWLSPCLPLRRRRASALRRWCGRTRSCGRGSSSPRAPRCGPPVRRAGRRRGRARRANCPSGRWRLPAPCRSAAARRSRR